MKLDVMVEGISETIGELNRYYGSVVDDVGNHIKSYTGKIQKHAKANVSVRKGILKRSIAKSYNRAKLVGQVYTRKAGWYAHMVEYGTKPHWMPKRQWMHPGAKPYPFMVPAWKAHKDGYIRGLRAILRRKRWLI